MRKRLVLFVEGAGDKHGVPQLVSRLITEFNGWPHVFLDPQPFEVGHVNGLTGKGLENWDRYIAAAAKRPQFGGVLVVLDGDTDRVRLTADAKWTEFCAKQVAIFLAGRIRTLATAKSFSVAVVFACCEFESWLIAGVESLAGKSLEDGRIVALTDIHPPATDLEQAPRGAKEWLKKHLLTGYKEEAHQERLTKLVDLAQIRTRQMRSFRRLECAVKELIDAFEFGTSVVSP